VGTFGNAIREGIYTYQKEDRVSKIWHQRYLKGSLQEIFQTVGSLIYCTV